jgi:hypothetical protein
MQKNMIGDHYLKVSKFCSYLKMLVIHAYNNRWPLMGSHHSFFRGNGDSYRCDLYNDLDYSVAISTKVGSKVGCQLLRFVLNNSDLVLQKDWRLMETRLGLS